MSEKALDRLMALAAFLVPFICYFMTMAASASFWDSGEFVATSYILGVPHSPGNPIYVLLGRVFSMLPLPLAIAQRINLLSVVFGAISVAMLYLVALHTIRLMYPAGKGGVERFAQYAGPFVGVLYLVFSDTFWRDSTEAEVYALSAFLMGLCTWLAIVWYRNTSGLGAGDSPGGDGAKVAGGAGGTESARGAGAVARTGAYHSRALVCLIVYTLALGVGFFLGTILVYPAIFLLFILVKEKSFSNLELIAFSVGLGVIVGDMTIHVPTGAVIAGLIIFVALLAWSARAKGSFALTLTGLLVFGLSVHLYLYIRAHFHPEINEVDPQTWKALYAHLRREQYPPVKMFVRKAPLLWQLGHFWGYFWQQFRMLGDVKLGAFNLGTAATIIPVGLGALGIVANYLRERKIWALNVANLLLNTVGLIFYLNFSATEVRARDYFYAPGFYFFAVFIAIGAAALLMSIAGAARRRSRDPAGVVVPVACLCIVLSILPARYNWFSHDRHRNYIARDYGFNTLAGLEQDAIIFTNGDNDTFPLWYIQCVERYRTDVRIANMSLLNTDWYIRQLRDDPPKVPMTFTDRDIANLHPVRLKSGGVAWKRDQAVQNIIQTTNWQRPIYFASTVPEEIWRPYTEYLEMQGAVRRIVPRKGKDLFNVFMVERNFDHIFMYRGVLTKAGRRDTTIYKDQAARDAYINYAVAAAQLGQILAGEKKYADAVKRMELSLAFHPDFKPARVLLGTDYLLNNEPEKAINHYRKAIRSDPHEGEYWVRLARVYEYANELPVALTTIDEGIKTAPETRQLYIDGFRVAANMHKGDLAKTYIKRYVDAHPDDEDMRSIYAGIDKILEEDFGVVPPGETPAKKAKK
jgi:hypothetical protein